MNGRIYDPLLGRFLSADITVQFPGDLQSYNRYSYVRNNPVTAIDPTGWYDVGGHLYATYIIAVAAGFDSDRASRLAHYSNYPDEHRETSASSPSLLKTGFDMIFHHDRIIMAQETLHMLNGAEGSAVFGIRASLQAEISECSSDPKRGLLIHALGDAYAHSNEGLSANAASRAVKLFKSPFGHLFRGHHPDEIGYNKDRKELFKEYANSLCSALQKLSSTGGDPEMMKRLFALVDNLSEGKWNTTGEDTDLLGMAKKLGFNDDSKGNAISGDDISSTEKYLQQMTAEQKEAAAQQMRVNNRTRDIQQNSPGMPYEDARRKAESGF
jgi:hypothetical protein